MRELGARLQAKNPFYFFEWFTVANLILVHQLMLAKGFDNHGMLAVVDSLALFGGALVLQAAAGVALRIIWALIRRDRSYLTAVRDWKWMLVSARLLISAVLVIHTYGWLKLLVPRLNQASFDAELWEIDRLLMLGYSPNVFFVNLFAESPTLLWIIDRLYAQAFYASLALAAIIFLSLPSNRTRIAYANGNAGLWITGAWLYLLFPSLGPCYRFEDVWDSVRALMPVSYSWQYLLITNYQKVLDHPLGGIRPGMRIILGIGAFPSLHVAFQLYVALWVGFLSRHAGMFFRLAVIAIFIGSIVTGWHYMIDSIAGAVIGFLAYYCSRAVAGLDREPSRLARDQTGLRA